MKGYSNYPYTMPVGDRNLNEVVTNGKLINEKDFHFVISDVVALILVGGIVV